MTIYKNAIDIKKLIKKTRTTYKDNLLQKLVCTANQDPKSAWELIKKLRPNSGETEDVNDGIPMSRWESHFKKLGQTPNSNTYKDGPSITHKLKCMEAVKESPDYRKLDGHISAGEIKIILKRLKNNKAASDDLILNEMLKYSTDTLIPTLGKLFNHVMSSGIMPKCWNITYKVPIFKKGDDQNPDNYRGISITSCLGKVFSAVLCQRLVTYLDNEQLLSENQAAFRKNRSTADHLFTIKSAINKYVNAQGQKLFCCFVDLKKAFDSVWRPALLLKLLDKKIGGKFYDMIKNMYSKTEECVKLRKGISDVYNTNIGIKQGDNLSPMLFNIFLDDLATHLMSPNCDPIQLGDTKFNTLLYADDLAILSTSQDGLQKCIDKLGTYCDQWGLKVNTDKTKVVIFRKAGKVAKCVKFLYKEKPIEIVNKYTYLGLSVNSAGNFTTAVKELALKGKKALFGLRNTLFSNKIHNSMIYTKLFDAMIRPILTYGSEVWSQNLLKDLMSNLDKLDKKPYEVVSNKHCKLVLGVQPNTVNWAARSELGRQPIFTFIIMQTVRYWSRILQRQNKLLFAAYQQELALDKAGYTTWATFLRETLTKLGLKDIWLNQATLNTFQYTKVKSALTTLITDHFNDKLLTEGKMRSFKLFKEEFKTEKYLLSSLNRHEIKAIAKIRLSSHNLTIETGRYTRPKATPPEQRICPLCHTGVEDEKHFILLCKTLDKLRSDTIGHKLLTNDEDQNFATIMKCTEIPFMKQLAKFITMGLQMRSNILQPQRDN
jgi:hypothetical protein